MRISFVFLLLATACASQPPVLKPYEVDLPIAMPRRLEPIAKPLFAMSRVRTSDSLAEKARAALVELNQRQAYEAELEAQLALCN